MGLHENAEVLELNGGGSENLLRHELVATDLREALQKAA